MLTIKTLHNLYKFSSQIPKRPVPNINQIKEQWNYFSANYNKFDYCPQTFYYSLMYMLQIWQAKNILQVACGTGKLLPIGINMKNPNANYLAVDLAPQMIDLTKQNLKNNLALYDSKLSFQEWLKKNKINIQVSNAEQPIKKPQNLANNKFDRIICNCVLMLTQNAQRMLTNLYNQAEKGCLLGVSVWGNKDLNNLMTSIRQSYLQANISLPQQRSNFHLYKKVPNLAQKCGWETVLNWQQNALFPALSPDSQKYKSFLFHQVQKIDPKQQDLVKSILMKKLQKYFNEEKRGINFSCELLILRKK